MQTLHTSLPPLPDASCALQHYIDAGVVEVLPWQGLDLRSGSEIRTEGMFAALNDCLYRHMYTSGRTGLTTQKKFRFHKAKNLHLPRSG